MLSSPLTGTSASSTSYHAIKLNYAFPLNLVTGKQVSRMLHHIEAKGADKPAGVL